MASWDSLQSFGADAGHLARLLEREEQRKINRAAAERAQTIFDRRVASDVGGDDRFSGWGRRQGVPLDTQIRQKPNGAAWLIPTRSGAGPITVAEQGRNSLGGFRNLAQGPGVNLRTGRTARLADGTVSVRARRTRATRRNNGVTRGKQTASDAVAQIEREIPEFMEERLMVVVGRVFDVS